MKQLLFTKGPQGPIGATLGTAMNNFCSSSNKVSTHYITWIVSPSGSGEEDVWNLHGFGPLGPSPLGPHGGHTYYLNNFESPTPKDDSCHFWLKSNYAFSKRRLNSYFLQRAHPGNCRDDDFPFQKIAFSVWENSEFRFKGLSKWKFRLAIDTVHKNSVYKRHTHYESGYFQRVTWSVSHCDIACTLRDWMIHVRCRTSWPHIAYVLCRECLLRAAMTALRLRIGQSTSQ